MNKEKTPPSNDRSGEMTVVLEDNASPLPRSRNVVNNDASPKNKRPRRNVFCLLKGLFNRRRAVVDDTLELAPQDIAPQIFAADRGINDLHDVSKNYNIASKPFASGGQGSISQACDKVLGCEVAIKSLHQKHCKNEQTRAAFFNEAQLTAMLDHPAIIPVHGIYGDDQQGMHLAMKMIHGFTLKDYLDGITSRYVAQDICCFDEKRSLRNRIAIFLRVCDAIGYAHSRGIIHCDLKPENIMLGKHHETYVTDWGIARRIEDAVHLDKINGTPGYIAPEMLLHKTADERSDIYSLGLILFEITALTPAFTENDLPLLLQKVQLGMHEPLKHFFKCRIEPDLAAIIRKAIAVDPDKRYQNVEDMAEDLRRFLANEEVSARKDNLFGRLARWGVNHRRGMMLTTLFLLLLGASSLAYTLTREIKHSINARHEDQLLYTVYSDVVETANSIEKKIRNIEYTLELLKLNTLLSATMPAERSDNKTTIFVPLEVYKNSPPPTLKYSASYRYKIDPYGVCVFDYLTREPVSAARLSRFQKAAESMRSSMLALMDNSETSSQNIQENLYNGSLSAKTLYVALKSGLFACYPGMADIPADFLPHTRLWYTQAAADPAEVQWSAPYRDASGNQELVTTCSSAIIDSQGQVIGVVAADFSLQRFGEQLLNAGERHADFTYEKLLIDSAGKIILRKSAAAAPQIELNDRELINRMLSMKHGTLRYTNESGEHLLVFSYIKQLKLLYVEHLDFYKLTQQ